MKHSHCWTVLWSEVLWPNGSIVHTNIVLYILASRPTTALDLVQQPPNLDSCVRHPSLARSLTQTALRLHRDREVGVQQLAVQGVGNCLEVPGRLVLPAAGQAACVSRARDCRRSQAHGQAASIGGVFDMPNAAVLECRLTKSLAYFPPADPMGFGCSSVSPQNRTASSCRAV